MLRNLITLIMVALFPLALKAQVRDTVPTYSMTGYKLGEYNPQVAAREIVAVAGEKHKVLVLGLADGNPWRSCGKNKQCSDHKNQLLADIRASEAAKALESVGLDTARITTRGEIRNARGEGHRGVMIYVLREKIATPNDSLAHVAREVDTLQADMKSVKEEVKATKDTVAQVAAVVQQIINNSSADTGKKEEKGVSLEIGPAYTASEYNMVTFGPAIVADLKNTKFKLVAQGGILPSGRNKKLNCSTFDFSGSLGLERKLKDAFDVNFGVFTDRRSCYDGGPKVNGTLTIRRDALYLGTSWSPDLGSRFYPTIILQGTYGFTTTLTQQVPQRGAGLRTALRIPLFGRKAVKDTTTSPTGR